jgi:2,4-dienoyl-CoA reductase-like NADH-dependent reductase (Old Yellow Enzyme family)/pyruvate/2-oxoglutarate dehydrogenase complex dihydrolipoamide dehydrogenase (E3) component
MFNHLFSPARIGSLEVPNRIVMLPMTTGYCESDETVGNRFIDFYAERARGGAGLIVIPFAPLPVGSSLGPGIYDDRFLPGVQKLNTTIHALGAKSACQLLTTYHAILRDNTPEIIAPSAVMNQLLRIMPRVLTREEIGLIVSAFGRAGRRSREGGFDAVEILVGAGYLLNRFLSPITNLREDEYGGSLENRMRIMMEVVAAIKKETGDDFPVGVRLNVEEQMPGGHTVEESKKVALALEKAGISFINVYTGWHESPIPTVAPSLPKGVFVPLAAAIKEAVTIPIITANRINDPFLAENIIAAGQADLVGMGRALLADPALPQKAREDRTREITPCLACSNCLSSLLTAAYKKGGQEASVICTVNPMIGQEGRNLLQRTEKPKRVFIAGGGPAGLEAAWTAAVRGHQVTLFEKQEAPGGWLRVACLPPHKEELRVLMDNLAYRALSAGAEIRLNSEVRPDMIRTSKPEVLILAIGASPLIPAIPGIEAPQVVSFVDILTGRKSVQGSVVIIGGGLVGCETAEYLVEKVPEVTSVTVLEMMDRMAANISASYRPFFLARLRKMGIRMETQTLVEEITDQGVLVKRKGAPEFIAGDAVVVAVGLKTDLQRVESFQGLAPEVYSIGDCLQPRMIKEAMEEGFAVGVKI